MSPNAHQLRAVIARATRPADLDAADTLITTGNPACAGRCSQGRKPCTHAERCTRESDIANTIIVAVGAPLSVLLVTALALRITWVDAINWLAMVGDVIGGAL